MKKVLIIQRLLPHYRADFFNRLKQKLDAQGIEFTLLYGKDERSAKKDEVELSWATYIPTRTFHLGKLEVFWQPGLNYLKDKELVIIEQANKNLINYLLIARRQFAHQKIAYWGHGRNRQTQEDSFRNSFKKFFINQCDWWFAYTQQVKDYLASQAFPEDKITCVQNAVDTSSMIEQYATVSEESLSELRNALGISTSDQVAIFCGGIYKEKRMSFLIDACDLIKKSIPNFHIVVVGSGTDAPLITEAAQTRKWIHYVGPKFDLEKVKHFKIASLFLMPGLLGLAVLDSFALQTPTITTTYPYHSPEIEYLEHNVNGIITEDNIQAYAHAVVKMLQEEDKRKKLVEGCKISAGKYTVEQMAENFANGIIKCLQQ